MEKTTYSLRIVKFGIFEVDLRAGELRKSGMKLKLSGQPFQVLTILLDHPGEVVTRDELQKRLWPDTFVDAEHNLNTAINRIREVLGDSAESPRFVETIPRRGYRFIAPIQTNGIDVTEPITSPRKVFEGSAQQQPHWRSRIFPYLAAVTAITVLVTVAFFSIKKSRSTARQQHALTRITFDEGLQIEATWSPDGRFIAYSSDRGGKFDIWVQQVSGGDPIQITKGPGHHWQPDWSPDGKYIAYRSEEGDGGIYVAPALGGAGLARKIAPFGYYPQWSPNSLEVLFQTHFTTIDYSNRFFVAQLDGSAPREVLVEFLSDNKLWATSAAWHPDGKRVTVWVGNASPTPSFWTVAVDGGRGTRLEVVPAVHKELAEMSAEGDAGEQLGDYSFSWSPAGDAIYFERGFRGARNIWKMTVDPKTERATGVDRLTTGPGPDAGLALSTNGSRLAFTAKSQRIQTWLFPFDATTGRIKGNGYAISSPGRTSTDPSLSPDGTKVAYEVPHGERDESHGMGFGDVRNEVWMKSLVDGTETPILADNHSRWMAQWSPDGTQLVYERRKLKTLERQLVVWSGQSRDEQPLTTLSNAPIGGVFDWSRDGKWVLASGADGIWRVPVASAPHAETAAQKIIFDPAYQLFQPHFSPDGRWIVFEAVSNSLRPESTLYIVPAAGGHWTRVTDSKQWDDKPRWSPDGKTIYFVSGPGGFFNVWGIRFDPAVGKVVGKPFQVSKFESPRMMIPRFIPLVGLSLTQDKLVLTMEAESGSIWMLDGMDY